MISGYMWNQIRKPPPMQVSQQGKPIYIANGYSNQFGVETQIISVLCEYLSSSPMGTSLTCSCHRVSPFYRWPAGILRIYAHRHSASNEPRQNKAALWSVSLDRRFAPAGQPIGVYIPHQESWIPFQAVSSFFSACQSSNVTPTDAVPIDHLQLVLALRSTAV